MQQVLICMHFNVYFDNTKKLCLRKDSVCTHLKTAEINHQITTQGKLQVFTGLHVWKLNTMSSHHLNLSIKREIFVITF